MGKMRLGLQKPNKIMLGSQEVSRIMKGTTQVYPEGENFIIVTNSVSSAWSPSSVTNTGPTLTWEATGKITQTIIANDPTFDLSVGVGNTNFNIYDVTFVTGLSLGSLNILSIDLTGLINLQGLILNTNTALSSIDISQCVSLTSINTGSCTSLGTIKQAFNANMVNFGVNHNNLYSLNLTYYPNLKSTNFSWNKIAVIDLSNNSKLETLTCYLNNLTFVDLSLTPLLRTFNGDRNNITGTNLDKILIDLDNNGLLNGTIIMDTGRTSASNTAKANLITKGWSITEQ